MSSSGQKKGSCGNIMAIFDFYLICVRCREKGIGTDPCVTGEESCPACVALTPEQKLKCAHLQVRQGKEEGNIRKV